MFQGKLVIRPAVYNPDKGLRHADNSDVHNVWALLGGYARESLLLPRTEEDIQEKIGNFRIAELDGKFVGCVALRHYGNSLYEVRSFAVAKPYVGQYACVSATLGGKDMLVKFREVYLELKQDGTFEITAVEKKGKVRRAEGNYVYDEENELLVFTAKLLGKKRTKKVFWEDGTFVIEQKVVGKNLVLKFRLGG